MKRRIQLTEQDIVRMVKRAVNEVKLQESLDRRVKKSLHESLRRMNEDFDDDSFDDSYDEEEVPYEPQAVYGYGGPVITIQLNDNGDKLRYQYHNEEPSDWQEIQYNEEGERYFLIDDEPYSLNDFIRKDYPSF